eukprot:scaffold282915_cov28-Tisochrysis_lutea.AAC.2
MLRVNRSASRVSAGRLDGLAKAASPVDIPQVVAHTLVQRMSNLLNDKDEVRPPSSNVAIALAAKPHCCSFVLTFINLRPDAESVALE